MFVPHELHVVDRGQLMEWQRCDPPGLNRAPVSAQLLCQLLLLNLPGLEEAEHGRAAPLEVDEVLVVQVDADPLRDVSQTLSVDIEYVEDQVILVAHCDIHYSRSTESQHDRGVR